MNWLKFFIVLHGLEIMALVCFAIAVVKLERKL